MRGKENVFAVLRGGGRVWAIGAVHGDAERLARLHNHLEPRLQPTDRVVYLGNLLGVGPAVRATVDEVLTFRRAVLARPESECGDVAFLRGTQEEMWRKLLQLHIAPNPRQVLEWMLAQGIGPTIAAYGGLPDDGLVAASEGPVAVNRWTSTLRANMNTADGHNQLMNALRHAACTDDQALLFVHAGIDPARALEAQKDNFWWNVQGFMQITQPFAGFRRVVRGFSRTKGLAESPHTVSLDGGCGCGGRLLACAFAPDGSILDQIEI